MEFLKDDRYWQEERRRMVQEQLIPRGINDREVLSAFLKVPRHRFIPFEFINSAYADHPLPIGEEQTISQPYIVALMTQCLELKKGDKVLEIGTGSGYQTAILAELNCSVYSIERFPSLARRAKNILAELGYEVQAVDSGKGGIPTYSGLFNRVKIKVGDGTKGWPEFSPYAKIIVTAAAPSLPPSLFEQLKEGGVMVIPLGNKFSQMLTLVRKIEGKVKSENICGCRFVSLVGEEGWRG
ncbi:MAG: protein-L-isoaspartate(D-aspartate) O-methyltransferase [Candidatus Omnitrophica bacterium]|nr:protein-L-isoaspartate(D-aspartate) O-methyltransferase [Candidatus Omnitrophota bacterium]